MAEQEGSRLNADDYEGLGRKLARILGSLDANQRLAGIAAIAMVSSLALPWFSQTGIERIQPATFPPTAPTTRAVSVSLSGFESFKWIEAALLLIACAVLVMLAARGEGKAFHLPGGDGVTIAAAGAWCLFLLFWRTVINKPEHSGLNTGVEWGLLVAFGSAAALLLAGVRIRALGSAEPPLPDAPDGGQATTAVDPYENIDPTVEQLTIPLGDQASAAHPAQQLGQTSLRLPAGICHALSSRCRQNRKPPKN
jgi:hypothetical protein